MGHEDPRAVRERFAERLPERFSLLNAIVFDYNLLQPIAALGLMDVDIKEREFSVVCINPLGVKLFEVHSDKDGSHGRFVIPALSEKAGGSEEEGGEKLARAVGDDIKRIYFDRVPSEAARAKKRKYKVLFREDFEGGTLTYEFAGKGGHLYEKRFYGQDGLSWKASYYDYRVVDGRIFPGGVVMDNYKYGYRLTVRLKRAYGIEQD
jgi:hypothetical protein